jgi:DNA-binding FadR family transcriptional regulator
MDQQDKAGTLKKVSLPLHRAVHDAIAARDPDAARLAMQSHLNNTERRRPRAAK